MIQVWVRLLLGIASLLLACPVEGELSSEAFKLPSQGDGAGFTRLSAEESGLEAISQYRDPRAWAERLEPASIGTVGTGIGVGDFNADGWPDLFVAMRGSKNRIYLNRNGQRFEDYTEAAGILERPDWTTGITVVDINGDTLPDVYVCFFEAPNRLYLNRGDTTFSEVALEWGLAISDSCSGAFFADYDKDGDLDLYLQTNTGNDGAGRPDYLLRNEGQRFIDVSSESGIRPAENGATLGHSVLWVDFNEDGWEDIYVANDFRAPDFLYLNNGDGTFRFSSEAIPIAPYSSMGSDVGDVNNDGRLDVLTTDMATPSYEKHVVSMLTSGTKTRDIPEESLPRQVMKNTLLLNRGNGEFVDVAYAWNLAATDWTWAPRLVDLDNDGWKDAFFSNGMIRQFHNADLALAQDRQTTREEKTAVFRRSPVLNERNLLFRNVDGRGFESANGAWSYEHSGVSFATALFDFDRDGDMDLVYTNYEAPPSLWRNDLGRGNSVQITLTGMGANTQAVGAVAVAHVAGHKQAQKRLANRGYLGSDEPLMHVGLGNAEGIELLEIWWPQGGYQKVRGLKAGRRYAIQQADYEKADLKSLPARFKEVVTKKLAEIKPALPRGEGLLYPFKPVPGSPKPRMIRADFNQDDKGDILILRNWESPRLIVSKENKMADVSEDWGLGSLKGIWRLALVEDFNGDGKQDVFLGGLGNNHEFSYRANGEGKLIRYLGRFSPAGPKVNLTAIQWGDEFRLFDGLRDYSEIEGRVYSRIPNFKMTGILAVDTFMQRTGFRIQKTYEIDHFQSGILLNADDKFDFVPLPNEAQYGRVWDAVLDDINEDGNQDMVLLLGQISPHYLSRQNEGSFITVLLGMGDGSFEADYLPPFDQSPTGRAVGLHIQKTNEKALLGRVLDDGRKIIYTIRSGE